MLRIQSTPEKIGAPQTPTAQAATPTPCASTSTGCDQPAPPSVETPEATVDDRIAKLEGNHTSAILPWLVEEIPFHTALDIGCGCGDAVRMLNEANYEAHGVDVSIAPNAPAGCEAGDIFTYTNDPGYFDVAICCNVVQLFENHQIPGLFAKMNELSNSYIVFTAPTAECEQPGGTVRDASWWVARTADFNWKLRILREDPETGYMIVLAEKPDSLAAKIMPLLEQEQSAAAAESNTPEPGLDSPVAPPNATDGTCAAILDDALELFYQARDDEAFARITNLADSLLNAQVDMAEITPIFNNIVSAMEGRRRAELIALLREDLLPRIKNI